MRTRHLMAVFLGFLVPGLGHFYLGKRALGIFFFISVVGLFVLGCFLGGGVLWSETNILTHVAYLIEFSNGIPFLMLVAAKMIQHQPQYFNEVGATFLLVSGSLNLLILIQIGDVLKTKIGE